MKRAARWLLLLLLPALAVGAECFAFTAWRQAVIAGDFDLARQVIARAVAACGCASDATECLALPGRATLVAPRLLRETTARFAAWTTQLVAACGSLPETNADERRQKVACHDQRAQQFAEGLRGEPNAAVFADAPPAIAERLTRSLRTAATTPTPGPADRYNEEALTTGRQICALSRKLLEAEDMLEHVHRRGESAPAEKRKREIELENAIKALHEQIDDLKQKFERLTGEPFNALAFCGAPDTPSP
jgi:hypothetical protein